MSETKITNDNEFLTEMIKQLIEKYGSYSEICMNTGFQCCDFCERFECCDNTNPQKEHK